MTSRLGGGWSSPPFSLRVSGPCVVAGNAWCLHEDLASAREIYGDIPVIAVNGAAREVKAFALYSGHPDRFVMRGHEWIRHQHRLFGEDFSVHSASRDPKRKELYPWVDYWWAGTRVARGTSAWAARKLAHFMGFDLVVLCGCPLEPGNYTKNRPGQLMTRPALIQKYVRIIESDREWHQGCLSMSGMTARILGSPLSRSPVCAFQGVSTTPPM